MKKLLMTLAIWFLNKCQTQPIQLNPGSCLLHRGKLYRITAYYETFSFKGSKFEVTAEELF